MPISLEQWRLAVGLWNARIQRTLVIRRGVKRAPSCQEGSPSASLQSHRGEKMFKTKKKARMKHKDGSLGDPVVATDNFCNDLIVLGASTTMCSGGNECGDGSCRSFAEPLLELLGCTVLGALLVIVMLLLRSGDIETNPGPVEGGASSAKGQRNVASQLQSVMSQNVLSVGERKCNMLFRSHVSRQAAGKGRAVLEGVGLLSEVIDMCYVDHSRSEEEAVQAGLIIWRRGGGESPTWGVLIDAMRYAQIAVHQLEALEEELLKGPDEGLTSCSKVKKEKFPYGSQLAQEYFDSVSETYSDMAITGEYPHVDYVGLKVSESHPSRHKKEDTVQFLRNFQKATVDFISQHDEDDPDIMATDQTTSGLLTHDHFLQQHKKRLHIVFGPPGAGKTSFSRHICSKFASNPQSSSHSLILLFHVRDRKVAKAKSLRDLLSCYNLPGGDSAYDELAQLVEKNRGRGVQIIFDGLDEHQGLLSDSTSIVSKLIQGELKEAQIMVTSRPGIVMQLSQLFNRATLYEVQGFGPVEVKEYVESFFCKEGEPSAASKFLLALSNRPDLTGSTYIPLNLWLLCSVFSFNNCSLPDTLTQCYTILFAQLLQRQAEKEGLGTTIRPTLDDLPESIQSMLNCLCQLSYQGFLNEILVFDEEMVINTCLASQAELKHNFDGLSLLHVHPKKHGAMDHLTFNFLHSTYQEYLCAKHIHGMSKEKQTAFWKKNISNPRYAMVFRFYCGFSQLQIREVQDIVKGQELPRMCKDHDRRLLFLFYALHESGNTHLTAAIASQLDRTLKFDLKMSSYDFYVTGHCLNRAVHLTELDFGTINTQETTDAIPCIASVASSNLLVSLELGLTELSLLDAKKLTSALSTLEELTLRLNSSSGDAVEKVLLIPTLKKLNLTVYSVSDWHTSLHPKSQSGVAHLDLDVPSKGLAHSCSQMEELRVQCDSEDAGDIIAAHLPKLKNLRKVKVKYMNPVPILLSARSCGKLDKVVIEDPQHCKLPADDGSEVSADLSACHLRQLELPGWSGVDCEVLKTCFSIVSSYSFLEELKVDCDTPDAGDIIAAHLPKWKNLRRVTVLDMNPVPVLLSARSCGKLVEMVIEDPKHCKVPADDGSEVSADLSACHLRRLKLPRWSGVDSEVLKTCFSIMSSYSSLEELTVQCDTPDAGDIIASHLPKWENLKKVIVRRMNPVPILWSTVSCGNLAEVVIRDPKHCKVPTGDGSVSVDLSAAHLRRLELWWWSGDGDSEVLRTCLSIVSRCSSLEELHVGCYTPDTGNVIASHLPKLKNLRKVEVSRLNPMPILSSVRLCGKLDEVAIQSPEHCKPTAEDWQAVAVTMASAQQLKKMELWGIYVPFLEACLPSLSSCPSLQELRVHSRDPSAGQVLADNVLLLRGVETLSIRDINPIPVLQVLSQNAKHSVSSMGISLEEQPDLLVGVSDLLSQCRTIRSFQLYLNKGPEALTALSHSLEGLCHSPSIEDVLISCLDAGAGPAVAQLLPTVVGHLLRFSVSLPDPTEVLSVLQDSSLEHFELVTPHMVHMTSHDQVRLRTLVSRVKSGQVSVVIQQEWKFPYSPWIYPNISLGLAETLCVCAGLSENPHIRGAEVSGVPPGLVSEVQCLLKTTSCHSVTVNRETVRQVEPCTTPELELSPALRMLPTGGFPSRSLLQRGHLGQGVLHKPTEEDQVPYELDLD